MKFTNTYTTAIQCSKLGKLSSNTFTYNVQDFSDVVCCKLPDDMPRDCELTDIYCLESDLHLDFSESIYRDGHRPWIDISKGLLDTSIGQHTYKLTFTHSLDDCILCCWFSYIIQDNKPDTPYIYMNRTINDSPLEEP